MKPRRGAFDCKQITMLSFSDDLGFTAYDVYVFLVHGNILLQCDFYYHHINCGQINLVVAYRVCSRKAARLYIKTFPGIGSFYSDKRTWSQYLFFYWHLHIKTADIFDISNTIQAMSLNTLLCHYSDFMMGAITSQITSLTIVYSTVYSGTDQWQHQSSASLAFVRGIHRWPVNSPHKWPVTRKIFPFDDVIMLMIYRWTQNCIDWNEA